MSWFTKVKENAGMLLVPFLFVVVMIVMISEAWQQDMKNRNDRDELSELRQENEELRQENWNLQDTNWILSTEINKIGAELKYLQKKEEGKE